MGPDCRGRLVYGYRQSDPGADTSKLRTHNPFEFTLRTDVSDLASYESTPVFDRRPMGAIHENHVVGAFRPTPDRKHIPSVLAGVVHRTSPAMPGVGSGAQKRLAKTTRLICEKYLTPLMEEEIISFDAYVDSLNKPEGYKRDLRQFHTDARIDQADSLGSIRIMASFIKDECYDSLFKYFRGIQGTSKKSFQMDIANYYGRIVRSIEEEVYQSLPCNIKHTTPEQRVAMVRKLADSGLITSDYSSFEASHSEELLQSTVIPLFEHMLERTARSDSRMAFIKWVLIGEKELRFRNGLSVKLERNVEMSGDTSTSLCNYLVNYIVWAVLLTERGKSLEEIESMLIIEGDDVLADPQGLTLNAGDFWNLGLLAKIETGLDKETAGFCQLYVAGDTICADPLKKLVSFSRIPEKYINSGTKCKRSLLRAQGLSMLHLHAGAPIVHELSRAVLRLTAGVNVRQSHLSVLSYNTPEGVLDMDWKMKLDREITPEARNLVEEVFGVTCEQQVEIEGILSRWEGGPLDLPLDFPDDWVQFYHQYTRSV